MRTCVNRVILIVDDDPDDFFLARLAFKRSGQETEEREFQLVSDGEELMDYLYRRGRFASLENTPLPCLILLDLNMPGKDGREALREMKQVRDFRQIPIVVFTTSGEQEDIVYGYDMGASSYISKPAEFDALVEIMTCIGQYWLNVVKLPTLSDSNAQANETIS
ncbi:Response regulator receiver protein [uncultured Desulfatiglans sp.]|uniref:Response regulator receiver protein n=1 Tax=Uncultured Desulfatiglans sp. TaxID=1748965 RepID=A0A653A281_UNCDX|nr:Response regulator receiver protein [uncultured Desulfatiglans sp.]